MHVILASLAGATLFGVLIFLLTLFIASVKKADSKSKYDANGCRIGPNGQPEIGPVYSGSKIIGYTDCVKPTSLAMIYVAGSTAAAAVSITTGFLLSQLEI